MYVAKEKAVQKKDGKITWHQSVVNMAWVQAKHAFFGHHNLDRMRKFEALDLDSIHTAT